MKKHYSIKTQLMGAFLFFTVIILFLSAASFLFVQQAERVLSVKNNVEQLHLRTLHLVKTDMEFFSLEIKNQEFYKTGKSEYLNKRAEISAEINQILARLQENEKIQQYGIHKQLDSVSSYICWHDSVFSAIARKMLIRGFKDYGMEGKMRFYAHELEKNNKAIDPVQLLTLRRHEKDFFLRGELVYIDKLNNLSAEIVKDLQKNAVRNRYSIELINSYASVFNDLTKLETEIGSDNKTGLRKQLDGINKQLEDEINLVTVSTTAKASEKTKKAIAIYFLTLFVSIFLSLTISYILSSRLSTPISNLSQKIDEIIKSGFNKNVDFEVNTSTAEVHILALSFKNLFKDLKKQLQLTKVKSETLKIQNKRLQHVNKMLQKSEKELKDINSVKDKFFSIIAHDLRGPIASLTSFLHILITYSDGFSREETKQLAISMSRSVNNLSNLLENLLEWSRTQMGNIEFIPSRFDLQSAVNRAVSLLRETAKEKDIVIKTYIDFAIEVFADKNMVEFILRNLLSNAVKFSFRGGKIEISATASEDFIEIQIADEGVGIASEDIDKLFRTDVFISRQGTAQEKGTGLGLQLSKEFVERNRGRIWVVSEVNKGARFYFTLLNTEYIVQEC